MIPWEFAQFLADGRDPRAADAPKFAEFLASGQDAASTSLEEHDRRFHPKGFDPMKETCEFRASKAEKDILDLRVGQAAARGKKGTGDWRYHTGLQASGRLVERKYPDDTGWMGKPVLVVRGLDGLTGEQRLDAVYDKAAENLPRLEEFALAVAEKMGGSAKFRPGADMSERMKDKVRARDKADVWYKDADGEYGDYAQLNDVIGATVVLPEDESFVEGIEGLRGLLPEGAKVACVKPYNMDGGSGYRDVKVSVRFPNGGVGEMILVEPYINNAKFDRGGHLVYELMRVFSEFARDDREHGIVRDDEMKRKAKLAELYCRRLTNMIYARGGNVSSKEAFGQAKRRVEAIGRAAMADPEAFGIPPEYFGETEKGRKHRKAFEKTLSNFAGVRPPPEAQG